MDSGALFLQEHVLRAIPLVALALWGVARRRPPGSMWVWSTVGALALLYGAMGFDEFSSSLWILPVLVATCLAALSTSLRYTPTAIIW